MSDDLIQMRYCTKDRLLTTVFRPVVPRQGDRILLYQSLYEVERVEWNEDYSKPPLVTILLKDGWVIDK